MNKKLLFIVVTLLMVLSQVISYSGMLTTTTIFYLNLSRSQPLGLYIVVSPGADPEKLCNGDIVVMRLPTDAQNIAIERDWIPNKDRTLLKTIWALPGESYSITDEEINVKGQYVGRVLDKDSLGRPMPSLRGNFTVQPGQFLPLATHVTNSFDGRYFGQVSFNLIIAKVEPFILFPEGIL